LPTDRTGSSLPCGKPRRDRGYPTTRVCQENHALEIFVYGHAVRDCAQHLGCRILPRQGLGELALARLELLFQLQRRDALPGDARPESEGLRIQARAICLPGPFVRNRPGVSNYHIFGTHTPAEFGAPAHRRLTWLMVIPRPIRRGARGRCNGEAGRSEVPHAHAFGPVDRGGAPRSLSLTIRESRARILNRTAISSSQTRKRACCSATCGYAVV
jgi:hypothetical protein